GPVLSTSAARTNDSTLIDAAECDFTVHRHFARVSVDGADDILINRWRGPEELARLSVQRVHHARLSWNSRDDLTPFTGLHLRIDPQHVARNRSNSGID